MSRILAALLLTSALAAPIARAGETLLLGFERDEVGKWAKLEKSDDAAYQVYHGFAGATGDATQGDWSLRMEVADKYGWLAPGNKTTYYILQRSGRALNAYGWLRKAMVHDWSAARKLRMDVKVQIAMTLRLELEDEAVPLPVVWTWDVPAGRWVTLEADLAAGAKLGLDLRKIAAFQLLIPYTSKRIPRGESAELRLDNIRLAGADDKAKLDVIAGDDPNLLAGTGRGEARVLEPMDMSPLTAAKPAGPAVAVEFKNKQAYSALAGKSRAIGAFVPGVAMLVWGPAAVGVSRDGGATWTNLLGQADGKETQLTGDVRGHRMTVWAEGNEVMAAFIPNHCAGGSGRTELHFYRASHADGRWTLGARSVFEAGIRHCADHLDLARLASGRVWVAWNHLNRLDQYEIRACFSDDDGMTWKEPAAGRRVGQPFSGIRPGPFLVRDGDHVACIYYDGQLRMSRFDGTQWSEPVDVAKAQPVSAVEGPGRTLWLATNSPAGVLRFDGKTWQPDNPPGQGSGLLCRAGDRVVCLWHDEAEGKGRVLYSVHGNEGWSEPAVAATHDRPIESLAAPRHAPPQFIPVAFSDKGRVAIYSTVIRLAQE